MLKRMPGTPTSARDYGYRIKSGTTSGLGMHRRPQLRRLAPAEHGRGFYGQRAQHHRDHVVEALVSRLLLQEIAAENHAQGGAVRQIEERERRDGNIEL